MNKRWTMGALLGCFAAVGCGGAESESLPAYENQHLNVSPSTLDQATTELARADRLLESGANQDTLRAELSALRDHMDELNGLVARVDVASDHVVNFFQVDQGHLVIQERAPAGRPSALAALDLSQFSAAALFEKLAPERVVPDALLTSAVATLEPVSEAGSAEASANQPARVSSAPSLLPSNAQGTQSNGRSQSALTASDGAFFRANFCPQSGIFFFCNPNWANGFFAEANATHSRFSLAPFAGGGSVVANVRVNGSTIGAFAVFMGEVQTFFAISGKHSVTDSGCCWICACGTHPEVMVQQHHWELSNAIGKSFHVGGRFMNDKMFLGFE